MKTNKKSGPTGIRTAQQPHGTIKCGKSIIAQNPDQKPNLAQNIRLGISTAAISIGVALLFVAAAADMTVSNGQITELCVLSVLSAFGGMLGLKLEGVMER